MRMPEREWGRERERLHQPLVVTQMKREEQQLSQFPGRSIVVHGHWMNAQLKVERLESVLGWEEQTKPMEKGKSDECKHVQQARHAYGTGSGQVVVLCLLRGAWVHDGTSLLHALTSTPLTCIIACVRLSTLN